MSEIEKKKEKIEEQTGDEETEDVISENVALLKAEKIRLTEVAEDLADKLAKMTDKYLQAKEFVDNDAKADLLADIVPRYGVPKELLMLKDKEELTRIKNVLDKAEIPAFKSGTRLVYSAKTSPRQKLDNVHDEYMAKIRGDS